MPAPYAPIAHVVRDGHRRPPGRIPALPKRNAATSLAAGARARTRSARESVVKMIHRRYVTHALAAGTWRHVSQLKHRVSCGLRAARRDRPVMEPVPASFVRHAKNGAERTATRRHRTDRREIQRGNPRPAAARRPAASNLAMPARNRRAFLAANGAQRASPDEIKRIPERSNSAAI
ncbi:hypothetical protein NYD60_26035 [Burkholderia thailandensis]|nr:hypothetical protein [Burkholderia thailandensis]MCS6503429.1 hypothetical protein [Burkholderia thailandensis]WRS68246.1 hypothetical protein U9S59_27650 [Burkholderia thailandensis]